MHRARENNRFRVRAPGIAAVVAITAVATAAATGSCFFSSATNVCESGRRCAPGLVCSVAQDACIEIGGCGDGITSPERGEVCDDGNTRDGDGCSADCKSKEACGNHIVDSAAGELCDDGNTQDGDGCSSKCIPERCGNKVLDPGEVCDDGNTISGDGCSADCTSNEACGNGITDNDGSGGVLHEDCDPTNSFPLPAKDTPECDSDCTFPQCGDGHLNPMYTVKGMGSDHNEQCDTGGDSPSCDSDCTFVVCGDTHVNTAAGEECDLGSNNSNLPDKPCRTDCRKRSCGDGIVDTTHGEKCDDGNHDNSDSCPDGTGGTCQDARCGDGFIEKNSTEECDDGSSNSDTAQDACRTNCRKAFCGDGVIDTGEVCDPGDSNHRPVGCPNPNTDPCSPDCSGCI